MISNLAASKATEQLTHEQSWRLTQWVHDTAKASGTLIHREEFAWNTEEHHQVYGFEGLVLKVETGLSQFGGTAVLISRLPKEGKESELVFRSSYQSEDNLSVNTQVDVSGWLPRLEPHIVKWERAKKRREARRRREARDMNRQKPEALEFLKRKKAVKAIAFCQEPSQFFNTNWQRDLERDQSAGLLPENEEWEGKVVEITFSGPSYLRTLYINSQHPDFKKWKGLRLSQSPQLSFSEEPVPYILPAWARFLRFK